MHGNIDGTLLEQLKSAQSRCSWEQISLNRKAFISGVATADFRDSEKQAQ